jgi:DNA-binding HxlR family transcriptional regulator
MSGIDEVAIGYGAAGGAVGPERTPRAGERLLTLLATPLNLSILQALSERPMRLTELRRVAGLPAQTTLRGHLGMLDEIGALRRRSTAQAPHAVEHELTPMGDELLGVASMLEAWLSHAPQGPVPLESRAARGIVKALVDGWSSKLMRGLAARPTSLTELDREISEVSYPALERRLSSMRIASLIEPHPGAGAGTPYAVTEWARRGIVPLALAGRCEHAHMPDRAAPVTQVDVEAAFMLAIPLVGLGGEESGTCRLEVRAGAGETGEDAGVEVAVRDGAVTSCEPGIRAKLGTFAAGSPGDWFGVILEGEVGLLRFGGDRRLAEALVVGLRTALTRF